MRNRARGILIENGKIALLHRIKEIDGEVQDYYVVPGGGIEENESLEDATKREMKEEVGIEVRLLSDIPKYELIEEKMNLKFVQDGDKFILVKRDADVDSVISLVDENISLLLLEYNDFRVMNDLKRKQEILKSIGKYIEENQSEYSKVDKETYSSIGYIMNNFGINHRINGKYKNYSDKDLLKWYDDCFLLVIHLIRKAKIKCINEERKLLEV